MLGCTLAAVRTICLPHWQGVDCLKSCFRMAGQCGAHPRTCASASTMVCSRVPGEPGCSCRRCSRYASAAGQLAPLGPCLAARQAHNATS
jgi:hypothetical protein